MARMKWRVSPSRRCLSATRHRSPPGSTIYAGAKACASWCCSFHLTDSTPMGRRYGFREHCAPGSGRPRGEARSRTSTNCSPRVRHGGKAFGFRQSSAWLLHALLGLPMRWSRIVRNPRDCSRALRASPRPASESFQFSPALANRSSPTGTVLRAWWYGLAVQRGRSCTAVTVRCSPTSSTGSASNASRTSEPRQPTYPMRSERQSLT